MCTIAVDNRDCPHHRRGIGAFGPGRPEGERRAVDTKIRPSLGSMIKAHRLARGLSQGALAERTGLSREAIGRLERGERLAPRRDTVTLLAKALQLPPDERARLLAAASPPRARTAIAASAAVRSAASPPPRLTSFVGREREIA